MSNDRIDLNDYHKQRNVRLVKEVSEQPSLSQEEFTEQVKQLRLQSQRQETSAGKSAS